MFKYIKIKTQHIYVVFLKFESDYSSKDEKIINIDKIY